MEETLRNLQAQQTAILKSLEYRVLGCEEQANPKVENHSVSEVFSDGSVPPRGSIRGRMVWPADSKGVCRVDVRVNGVSEPYGDTAWAGFSMQVLDEGAGVVSLGVNSKEDYDLGVAIAKAEEKLHKKGLTQEDLDQLVANGDLDPEMLQRVFPKKSTHPL